MINPFFRYVPIVGLLAIISLNSMAQAPQTSPGALVYSASSAWEKVVLKPATQAASVRRANIPVPTATTDFRPAFTGDFVTNRNYWRAGNIGDYRYQIGRGSYSIRKRNVYTQKAAFSSVALPQDINLNRAEVFTIKVDVLADSGKVPTGGILFGVKDSLNFCAFTTNGRGDVSIKRVANGETFADYMPGAYFRPGVPVDKNRNRLTIKRRGEYLHFYINEQEVRSSPYLFRILPGNGIGFTSSGYWTAFQKLIVTVGL
ncbi:hypothetical protein [Spirosoma sp. KNUC1025]|uniref:hypothetical protein n=1 Tax=Spirosoma sp. KNUC1025 TaxID=2894082 RepID=UPI00386926F4|nr:hypothetical protein LN737_25030 [Spirosoma sp. KNUC1025]